MILGIGIDTVSIQRVNDLILKFGQKFEDKIFTHNEIAKANSLKTNNKQLALHAFYAKRFAAKEAFSKALGLGIGRGVDFKDIEIDNDTLGKPFITLLNDKDTFIKGHFGVEHVAIHLSLSDELDAALAMVTISK